MKKQKNQQVTAQIAIKQKPIKRGSPFQNQFYHSIFFFQSWLFKDLWCLSHLYFLLFNDKKLLSFFLNPSPLVCDSSRSSIHKKLSSKRYFCTFFFKNIKYKTNFVYRSFMVAIGKLLLAASENFGVGHHLKNSHKT